MKRIKDKLSDINLKKTDKTLQNIKIISPLKIHSNFRRNQVKSRSPDAFLRKIRNLTPESERCTPDVSQEHLLYKTFYKDKTKNNNTSSPNIGSKTLVKIRPIHLRQKLDKEVKFLKKHKNAINALNLDKAELISASSDYTVRKWDTANHKSKILCKHSRSVISVKQIDGKIISASICGAIRVASSLIFAQPRVSCMDLLNNIHMLVCGKLIEFFDINSRSIFRNTLEEERLISSLCIQSTSTFLIGSENYIKLYDTRAPRHILRQDAHKDIVTGVCSDGQAFYTCSLDETLKLWDLRKVGLVFSKTKGMRLNKVITHNSGVITGGEALIEWGKNEKVTRFNDFIKDLVYSNENDEIFLGCSSGIIYGVSANKEFFL